MDKAADAFRTISEVAEDLNLPQHVLRFWETKFPQIKPLKRGGGRRYYRPDDVDLLKGIRYLLYGQGYTIKGVQRIIKEHGPKSVIAVWLNLSLQDMEAASNLPPLEITDDRGAAAEVQTPTSEDTGSAMERAEPQQAALPALVRYTPKAGVSIMRGGIAAAKLAKNPPKSVISDPFVPNRSNQRTMSGAEMSSTRQSSIASAPVGSVPAGEHARAVLTTLLRDLLTCRQLLTSEAAKDH